MGKVAPRRIYYGWLLVMALGFTETISWGVLNYSFTVYLAPMENELRWSRAAMTGAFSLSLLIAGCAAIPLGRWLDRHGPRLLMTAGSLTGPLLVLAWSRVDSLPRLYLIWAGMGLTMAATLYDPAFAMAATWFERQRVRALTVITLMAGFASTIFIPLAGWLVQVQGWRASLVTLAAILALGTIAPHALLLRRRPEDLGLHPDGATVDQQRLSGPRGPTVRLGEALRDPSFRWLTAAFWLSTLATIALGVHLVLYLGERGYDPTFAATLTGFVGAMQVAARLLLAPLAERLSPRIVAALTFALQPVALVVLLLARTTLGVFAFVVLFGAARGTATVTRPTLVAHLYGRARYASVAGVLQFALSLAQAIGPVGVGAAYDALGSYEPILWGLAGLSALAVLAVLPVRGQAVQSEP